MAENYTTPGVGFREVDNTVRPNAEPGDGIGAIVINANRGLPNQRVLCTTIDKFHEFYGTPDDPNQYGHFAAQVYFEQGGATQLLVARATMGDEKYAQIQYPYTDADASDKNLETSIKRISFVDNELGNNLKLIDFIKEDKYSSDIGESEGFEKFGSETDGAFGYKGISKVAEVNDIFKIFNGNPVSDLVVYRDREKNKTEGKAAQIDCSPYNRGLLAVTSEIYSKADSVVYIENVTGNKKDALYYGYNSKKSKTVGTGNNAKTYYEHFLHIPAKYSLNGLPADIVYWAEGTSESATKISAIVTSAVTNTDLGQKTITFDAERLDLVDWDDGLTKSYVVANDDATDDGTVIYPGFDDGEEDVYGFQFTEYGSADSKFMLVTECEVTVCSSIQTSDAKYQTLLETSSEYGIDVSEIANDSYVLIKYTLAKDEDAQPIYAIGVVDKDVYNSGETDTECMSNAAFKYKNTWTLILEHGSRDISVFSTYGFKDPNEVIKPWQIAVDNPNNEANKVTAITAISSTEVFSDPSGIWKDGYTPGCETDAEPGNGDIEMYQPYNQNQLVIGAIGPGEFGNDVGISIITPEAALYPSLYGQNAFSWLYRYDDEDKVDAASLDYKSNEENLTWKKVYRINVYVKLKSKRADVWGFGLDALMSTPVESYFVSNDPTAKDENGNSLWAPYVINGHSKFIYVSKKSVEQSVNYRGEFSMPEMTFSIYQLTGGANSKLNNVKEKMKALDLFQNRRKANYDYIFNVEPVDTFSGKQRYMALMNRIGQIAMKRKMDLGIIQVTSKEAKTIRQKVSEAKMFSFADGSYVAAYDDYDRYFDPFTSNWVMLPRSVAGATACCFVDTYAHPWDAPAGTTNGIIAYSDRPMTILEEDEFGQLYSINVNSAEVIAGVGTVLMGQKTMLKKESALNRIDIRKLCNYIEKRLEPKLIHFLYRKNTPTTRSTLRTSVDTFMGRIQSGQGILSRKVEVVPDPKDTHLVYVNISFVPAEAIERIEVTLIINRATGTITPVESTTPISR